MNLRFNGSSRVGSEAPARGGQTHGVPPDACCFDFDGLLVDSAALWARAYADVCKAGGGAVDRIDLIALRGASVPAAAAALSGQLDVPIDPTELHAALGRAFAAQPPVALSGVVELLDALVGTTPLVVVTNGPGGIVEETLTLLGLRHHFDGIVSADRVARPKPAPDVYLAACDEAGVLPAAAVAFEDSPAGAAAARAAGLRVVGVPSGTEPLTAELTVARIDDPQVLRYLGVE